MSAFALSGKDTRHCDSILAAPLSFPESWWADQVRENHLDSLLLVPEVVAEIALEVARMQSSLSLHSAKGRAGSEATNSDPRVLLRSSNAAARDLFLPAFDSKERPSRLISDRLEFDGSLHSCTS